MPRRTAFTIIEMSVVLTVIALIAGGVIVGKSLIRNGEMQNVIAERAKYDNIVKAFREKYKAWPGDMADAYDYWGTACGTNTNDVGTGCNGNGDGSVFNYSNGENVKAWEHLSLAGMVPQVFDGSGVVNATVVNVSATNIMTSSIAKSYWAIDSNPLNTITPGAGLYLHYGSIAAGASNVVRIPNLSLGEALALDIKIDDGQANSGAMLGDSESNCYDNGTDYYRVLALGEDATGNCVLHFVVVQ